MRMVQNEKKSILEEGCPMNGADKIQKGLTESQKGRSAYSPHKLRWLKGKSKSIVHFMKFIGKSNLNLTYFKKHNLWGNQ